MTQNSNEAHRVAGDLKNFSIFDITHTLMMSRKTALVSIQRGQKKGYVYFQDGQIVSALDDDLNTGEKAAFKIFFWRGGHFTIDFDVVAPERNIKLQTENLLLEIARNLDENTRDSLIQDDGSDASGAVEEQFEDRFRNELNKVFQQVESSTSPSRARYTVAAFDALLAALNDLDGTALFLRPGCRPRIKTREGFTTIKQEAVKDGEIEGFLNALLSNSEASDLADKREISAHYATDSAGAFTVRAFYDQGRPACIFTPSSKSIPPLASLGAEASGLADYLGRARGLVILTGPLASGKSTLLAALLEEGLRKHDLLITSFSRAQSHAYSEECGFIIRAPLNRFSLGASGTLMSAIDQGSNLIAVDEIDDRHAFHDAVMVAARSTLVLAVMDAEGLLELADRLTDLTTGSQGDRTRRRLARALLEVVEVDLAAAETGGPVINRMPLDDTMREAMARGQFEELAAIRV
ncbi:MAG: DUF4388 domain-containing protein [Planctomycetes bacterium]|nr:DUF4388 domain-containing protein [Planctomycetota bacterium]